MEVNLIKAVSDEQLRALDNVRKYTELLPIAQKLEAVMKRWTDEKIVPRISPFNSSQFLVNVHLDRISDIEGLLLFLEVGLDVNFDRTEDVAAQTYAWRTFLCQDAKWLRVDANLNQDGPGCRRVIKGYTKPEPIYEIQCLNEVDPPAQLEAPATPQLTSSGPVIEEPDDIPF